MFTGIVEIIGTVANVNTLDTSESGGKGWTITIKDASEILDDCHLGDSIAINGTCLTVTEFDKDTFKVGVSPETLKKTNLGELQVGAKVNLERAMGSGIRFGGHFVQGHVDDTVSIISIVPEGNSLWFKLQVDNNELMKYIIPKGYIALDGTSLTVCEVNYTEKWFTFMMVAYTQGHVIMPSKNPGDRVNIEVDMLGKYVERIVSAKFEENSLTTSPQLESMIERIVQSKLNEMKQ
ncbi:Riboflavin synthase alpha chain [Basidiobolus ranarum]|uniref:Riboflavin synthase alpha chain n=2 Tax=Basidiobolus ranarum TaxID=34480 RepID=A0ABR2VVF0_9FUNG